MMARKDSGITDFEGLDGGTICVQSGTTYWSVIGRRLPRTRHQLQCRLY